MLRACHSRWLSKRGERGPRALQIMPTSGVEDVVHGASAYKEPILFLHFLNKPVSGREEMTGFLAACLLSKAKLMNFHLWKAEFCPRLMC